MATRRKVIVQALSASTLTLVARRRPSDADIDKIGNVCRCGTYARIRQASGRRPAMADPRRLAAALVLLALAVPAGCDAGPARPAPSSSVVAPNGLDLLFAKMMLGHHAQAVTMSRTLLAKPGVPERVGNIAGFIAHDQQREIDEMSAWLRAWGQDPADPAIARLHGPGGGHGMLTAAQLAEIADAAPAQATDLYLRHMIEHHRGAITMARSALDGGANVYIRGLAKHIINEQTAENESMNRLLAELA